MDTIEKRVGRLSDNTVKNYDEMMDIRYRLKLLEEENKLIKDMMGKKVRWFWKFMFK